VPHANAPLTELGRLRLARCVVDDGWPLRRAAERFQVSVPTAGRWAARYRDRDTSRPAIEAMRDTSSRPHRSPRQTPARLERKVCHLRRTRGWGPARIGPKLGLAPSTVHRVLRRAGMPRLRDVDLASRQALRREAKAARYERAAPGELVHVDIKKLGRIPDGGGHRVHGRVVGGRNSRLTAALAAPRHAGTATCTPRWTITAGSPTPRSCPTSRARPRPGSGPAPWSGSPLRA
jgi:transposase